jgi:arylsulfatase
MKTKLTILALGLPLGVASAIAQTNLPLPPPPFEGTIGKTYKESTPAWPKIPTAAEDAPNVVIILLDDVGFGQTSTFGGLIPTPNLDKLASEGLRYNRFHTTAVCGPSRAALLTGRNHHDTGNGYLMEWATGFPSYTTMIPRTTATMAEVLRDNGYSTWWYGKNHNTPDWETSVAGPFDRWPTGMGFDYFYGFNAGEAHQYYPVIFENTTPVEPDKAPEQGYHLLTDMTDRAIARMKYSKSVVPNKPFFMYFAPGAMHAPHHAPKEWANKFKGQFDQGWNKVSEETFARMKKAGIIPAEAKHNPIPAEVGVWDELEPDRKKVYARMMEVYAGYLAYTDHETGRLLDAINELGVGENTLVIYAVSDNGASAEGGFSGTLNEVAADFNSYRRDVVKDALKRFDEIGWPTTYNHYPVGWALAMNSPFKYAKRMASHFGGTRNGLVISWPKRIKDVGTLRSQFHHCIDIAPAILEAAGLPQPEVVGGVKQTPMSGVSMVTPSTTRTPRVGVPRSTSRWVVPERSITTAGWRRPLTAATRGPTRS